SWLVAIAFTLGLTAFQLAPNHEIDNRTVVWYINAFVLVLAAISAILFHEAAHALVGDRLGRTTDRVSIYPLGGVAEDYNDPGTPARDATIAIAGPVASALLALPLVIIWALLPHHTSMLSRDIFFLAAINLILAIANLLPGYPLDGGRIFRAFV